MDSQDNRDKELENLQNELQERETTAMRLQELELEIYGQHQPQSNEPPLSQKKKQKKRSSSIKTSVKNLGNLGKFLGVFFVILVLFHVAFWLGRVIVVGAIAWVLYKVFLESDADD